jgi:RHS repeat-associated protein
MSKKMVISTVLVAIVISMMAVALAFAANIIPVTRDDAGARALAEAMVADPFILDSARFVTIPPSGTPHGTADALSFFPTHGSSFAILTVGNVMIADDPNTSGGDGTDLGGSSVRGNTDYDVTILELSLQAPPTANCLRLDFAFYSEEFPEYVGDPFNDAFIAELDTSTWTTISSTINAPDNFAFDQEGNVISVNSVVGMNAGNAAGTTYDGATVLLQAATVVTPGAHTLYLSIFDQADHFWDSAVFIDNIHFEAVSDPARDCKPGAGQKGPPLPPDQTWAPSECPLSNSSQAQNQAGGPINTYSGNYNFQQEDISIATLGQSLRFERSYNSGAAELYTTTLGYGWTHNYGIDLVFPDDPGGEPDTVILKAPHGSRLRFTDNGDGTYDPYPGVWAGMTREGSDPYTYTITATNQTVYTFSGDEQVSGYVLGDEFEDYEASQWLKVADFETDESWEKESGAFPNSTVAADTMLHVEGSQGLRLTVGAPDKGCRAQLNTSVIKDYTAEGRFTADDFVYVAVYIEDHTEMDSIAVYFLNALPENDGYNYYWDEEGGTSFVTGWNYLWAKKSAFQQVGSGDWSTITDLIIGLGQDVGDSPIYATFDDLRIVRADPDDSTVGNDTGSAWDFPSGQWHVYDDTGSYSLGQIDAQAGVEKVALVHEEPEADVEYRAAVQAKRDDGLVGLTFRMGDGSEGSEDGYAFLLDTASDQLALRSYVGGTPTDVTSTVSFSGAVTDTWYYLGVRTEGDRIRAYASSITSTNLFTDTNLQFDVTDATHTSGRAGLMTIGTLGRFDDVSLLESYEEPGHLVSVRDPQGNVTQFTYTDGRLSRVTEPTGQRYLDLGYDGQGRLAQISDPINRTVQYGYDLNGDLGVVTDTRGLAWTVTYTGTHLLYEIVDPEGHTVERQEYDGQGRVTHQWDGLDNELVLTYNADDTVTVTDPRGNMITDTYGTRHTLASQENPLGSGPSYIYDADFNRASATDENDHSTYYEWEACCGLLSAITDTLGNATHMGYDGRNNLTSRTDALGRTTTYEYDGNDLIRTTDPLTGTVEYTYTVRGQVRLVTDENDHTTTYRYDGFGQRVAITDALDTVTRFGYDGVGRLITTTVAAGTPRQRVTVNEYDNGDNLVRVTENYLAGQPQNHLNEYNLVTEYAYDGAGNRTVVTDTLSVVTMNQYDAANRLMRTIENYDPAKAQNEDDVYNIVTEYGYDEAGNQVTVTDTLGRVTRTEYDELNRPVTVTVNYVQGGPVDAETNVTTLYGYDAVGNRITVTDALGRVTKTEPDELNRPVTVTVNYVDGGYDPDYPDEDVATVYGYDEVGNQTTVTYALGRVTRTEYDELNRSKRVVANYVDGVYDPAHPDEDVATEYAYDPAGNRTQITDPVSRITRYEYDDLNRPVTVTLNYVQGGPVDEETNVATLYGYDVIGDRTLVVDANDHRTDYDYDSLGRLITVTNALSGITDYEYDALGNRTLVVDANGHETGYQYDALNRLEWVTDALTGTVHYGYDALGNRTSVTDQISHTTTYGYDDLNRLEQATDAEGHTTTYGCDRVGNRTSVTNDEGETTTYEYDDLNRLEAVVDPGNNRTEYGYDAAGNRVSLEDAKGIVTGYEYDDLNRLTGVVENYVDPGPVDEETNVHTTYGYDAAGNRTSVTDAVSHTMTYEYDDLNRLEGVVDPLTNRTEYGYDRVGNRTVMTDANGFTTFYTYDDVNRLILIDYPAPDPDVTFGYDGVGNRVAMTDTTGTTHYVYDPLYRLTEVTDGAGQAVGYQYDGVGNRTQLTYPGVKTVDYTYDDANWLETVTDWDSQVVTYTYDGAHRLRGVDLPNSIHTAYGYDEAGRLLTVTHGTVTGTLAAFTYTLDAVGNRVQAEEFMVQPSPGGGSAQALSLPSLVQRQEEGRSGLAAPLMQEPEPTDTPVPTDTLTTEPTPTEEPTPTDTPVLSPTETPTATEAPAPTETSTEEPTPTEGPTPTETPAATEAPTPTEEPTPTETPTEVPGDTPTATGTTGPTEVPTLAPTVTATATPTPSETPSPEPTATASATATLTITPPPPLTVTPTATATLTPTVEPGQLSLDLTADPTTVAPDQVVTVSLRLANSGPSSLDDVTLTAFLPPDLTYQAPLGEPPPQYDPRVRLLVWPLETLAPEQAIQLGYRAQVASGAPPGPLTLAAQSQAASLADPVQASTTVTVEAAIEPTPTATPTPPAFEVPVAGPPAEIRMAVQSLGEEAGQRRFWLAVYVADADGLPVADGTEVQLSVQNGRLERETVQTEDGMALTRLHLPPDEVATVTAVAGPAGHTLPVGGQATDEGAVLGELLPRVRRTRGGYGDETLARIAARNAVEVEGGQVVADNVNRRVAFQPATALLSFVRKTHEAGGQAQSLAFRLTGLRVGQESLLPAQGDVRTSGNWIAYQPEDQPWQMVYEVGEASVEQFFVFEKGTPTDSDLVIEGQFLTPLQPILLSDEEGVLFKVPNARRGDEAEEGDLAYGPARVEDARGRRLTARLELRGRQLQITVPADWLARAEFPVVIDPLIGPAELVSDLQGEAYRPAVASDGTNFLVVWDWNGDIYGQIVDGNGDHAGDLIVINQAEGSQRRADVVYNPVSGEYLVAWADMHYWPYSGLYAQRVSTSGALIGDEIQVAPFYKYLGYRGGVQAAVSEAGDYLIVWSDDRSGSDYDVFGQMLDQNGALDGSVIQISGPTSEYQCYADVAYDDQADTFLVVWADLRGGTEYDLYGQRLDADGGLLGSEKLLVDTSGQDNMSPAMAGNDNGQFLVTWYREISDTDYDVFAVRVAAATGDVEGGIVNVDTSSSRDKDPAVAAISSGEYLVVWAENGYKINARRVGSDGSLPGTPLADIDRGYLPAVAHGGGQSLAVWEDYETAGQRLITGQRISGSDSVIGDLIYVSPYYTVREEVSLAYQDQAGQYLLVWEQAYDSPQEDIFAQRVDDQGQPLGEPVNLTGDPDVGQWRPRIAAGPPGSGYLVVWEDERNESTTGVDIYGHLLDHSGYLSGTLIAIATAANSQQTPAVAYNAQRDEYLVAWADYRNYPTTHADIFAQRVGSDGSLVGGPISIVVDGYQGDPDVAYNPDEDTYLIVFEDQRPGSNSIDVFAQVVTGDGSLSGPSFEVSGANRYQYDPALAYSQAGHVFLVAWGDNRDDTQWQWDIFGQIISGTGGSLIGGDFAISSPSSGSSNDQEYPDVGARRGDPSAEFVVVWQDRRNGWARDVYLQRVDGGGNLLDEPDTPADETDPTVNLPIAVDSSNYFERPAGVYNPDDDLYLLAWTNRDDGGVYAQRYTPSTPAAPTASFGADLTGGIVPLTVVFTDTSTGQIGNREWDFGDGSDIFSTTVTSVSHTYLVTGTLTAVLTVSNPGGWDSASALITATEQITPSLDEDFEGYGIGEDPLYWLDQGGDTTDRDDFEVLWDDGNLVYGTDYTYSTVIYSHYAIPGWRVWQDYQVAGRMRMTDADGSLGVAFYSQYPAYDAHAYVLRRWSGSEEFELVAYGEDVSMAGETNTGVVPTPNTWYPFRVQAATHADQVTFRAKVWAAGEPEPGLWQAEGYDDGGTRFTAGAMGLRTYGPGSKHFDDLVVTPLGIQSDFGAAERTGATPYEVTFVAEPIGQVITYTWAFGDGSDPVVTGVPTATYTYTSAGTFDVGLTVEGPAGSDTFTRTDYILTYEPGTRVTDDLQVLYTLEEGGGTTVQDVSGVGDPLDLTIADEGAVTWISGGLSVHTSTIISSGVAASKVISASKASHEVTLEAWVKPANTTQDGPARIVTLSPDLYNRNFTLGQSANLYNVRLRTTTTGNNGTNPSVSTPAGSLSTDLTHVVYTRDAAGQARVYLDNVEVVSATIGGDLSNWDETYPLALANELTEDRPWLGELHLVAVYSRALDAAEVERNYDAGANPAIQAPVAGFSAAPLTGTVPLTVTFTNTTTGEVTGYEWAFGDGITSAITHPTHVYTATGVYTVSLTATGPGGSDTLTRTDYITVYGPVVADFVAEPLLGTVPLTVTFTNLSTPTQAITSALWVYGDGVISSTLVLTHTHTYTASGVYTVALTVAGPAGSDTFTRTDYIFAYEPGPRVTDDLQVLYTLEEGSGTTVQDVSGVGDPLDLTIADEGAVTWISGGLSVHTSTIISSGVAASKVISASKASHEVTIEAWVKPGDTIQGGPARIVTLSSDPSNRNFTLGQSANFYNVRLRTTTTGNNGDTPSVSTPAGSLSTDLTHVVYTRDAAGQARVYLDKVEVVSATIGGDLSNWDETYPLALANELTEDRPWLGELHLVAVYSRALDAAEVEQNYDAGANPAIQAPVAGFSAAPLTGTVPLTVTFTNTTTGEVTGYEWAFGDGITSAITHPTHVYTATGVYTVSLTAIGPGGSDTLTRTDYITVTEALTADFVAEPLSGAVPLTVTFTNLSTPTQAITSALWVYGDGVISSTLALTHTHTYTASGVYTVALTVEGPAGSDTLTRTDYITVSEALTADFVAEPLSGTVPLTVTFTNLSTPTQAITSALWVYGDGVISSTLALTHTHTYTASGVYTVALTVEGPAGSDTLTRTDYILTYEPGPRVTDDLQVLYSLEEGSGTTVQDVSGVGDPLDLTIADEGAVTWISGGLSIHTSTIISSGVAASKVISASKASHEVTLEAWVKPANTTQDGPARIVTLSPDLYNRNFTLGQGLWGSQPSDLYNVRLRTTTTGNNGDNPSVSTPAGSLSTDLTHVVYTRDAAGQARVYLDNVEVVSATIGGDLSNWDETYPLALANELTEDRPWLGELHLVAVYSRALDAGEVEQNYDAGANPAIQAPVAGFSGAPLTGTVPLTVTFTNTTTGEVTGYEWAFGDGITSAITHPTHVYTASGVYTVALTVEGLGRSDTLTRTNYITVSSGMAYTTTHRVISYTYDSLYRLITATYSSGEFYHYTYDAVGNRQSLTTHEDVVNYQYDNANRLVMAGGVPVGWDNNGNMTSFGSQTYTYDRANRLTQVVSGTLTTGFTYNGAGDRVAKTVDGVTTAYVLDPAAGLTQVLQETTDGQTTSYLYGHDLLAQYDSGTWAYHVDDGLGSVRQLADRAGQVVQGYSFSPFGVPLGESGGEPYGFTGEQWDASAGLVYLRARYYSPQTGRFITEDQVPGYVRIPKSLHVYVYAWNKPTLLTDPSGWQVPPEDCSPGEICAGGTTGPYVVPSTATPPTQPIEPSLPSPVLPMPDPQHQIVICAAPFPEWLALHYYRPGSIRFRKEVFPASVGGEIPTPYEGVQLQGEGGIRHVIVYDLRFRPLEEYQEPVGNGGLALGAPEVNVEVPSVEITDEDLSLGFSAEVILIEIELQVGGQTIQGMLYLKQPSGVVHKLGYGLEIVTPQDRYLLAHEDDVEKAGGYELYGWRRLGESYKFEGVVMRAFEKGTIQAWWYSRYHTAIPNQPEVPKLEEFP